MVAVIVYDNSGNNGNIGSDGGDNEEKMVSDKKPLSFEW